MKEKNLAKGKNKKFLELGKDFFSYGLMSAFSKVGSIILLPFLAYYLTKEDFGSLDIALMVTALLRSFLRLSLPNALNRYFQESTDRKLLLSSLLVFISLSSLLLAALGTFFSPYLSQKLYGLGADNALLYLALAIAAVTAIGALPLMQLRLERRIYYFGLIQFAETTLYCLIAVILLGAYGQGARGAMIALLLAQILSLLISLYAVRNSLVARFDLKLTIRSLYYSIPLVPSVLASQASVQITRILILAVLGLSDVGVFAATLRLAAVYEFGLFAFQKAWQPFSLSLVEHPHRNDIYSRTMNYFLGAALISATFFLALSEAATDFLLPPEYYDALYVLPWLVGAAIFHQIGLISSLGILVKERTSSLSVVSVISALLNLILTYILIKSFGLKAIATGFFLSEAVFAYGGWHFTRKFSDVTFELKKVIIALTALLALIVLYSVIPDSSLSSDTQSIVKLSSILVSFAIAYIVSFDRHAKTYLRDWLKKKRVD